MPTQAEIAESRLKERDATKVDRTVVRVEFRQCVDNYNPGEIAAFPPAYASRLVAAQAAVYVDEKQQKRYQEAVASANLQQGMASQPDKTAEQVLFETAYGAMTDAQRDLVNDWSIAGATQSEALQRAQQGIRPVNTAEVEIPPAPEVAVDPEEAARLAENRRREAIALAAQDGPVTVAPPVAPAPPAPPAVPEGMPPADADPDARP